MGNLLLLVDMDEVLVDFISGACAIHGTTREALETKWELGHWSIVEPLGLTLDTFWQPIHAAGEQFWIDLLPLAWAQDLIRLLDGTGLEWHVVSAPSCCATSYNGKVKWLKQYFGASFDRFIITRHKHVLARYNSLLIDDRERNVDQFVAYGGRGLVFPSRGNRLHAWAHDPLVQLRMDHRLGTGLSLPPIGAGWGYRGDLVSCAPAEVGEEFDLRQGATNASDF